MAELKEMYKAQANSIETSIVNNISATEKQITVANGSLLPDAPSLLVLGTGANAETVKLTDKDIDILTVERGFQGAAKSWNAGTIIARNFTAYDHDAFMDNIEEINKEVRTKASNDALEAHKEATEQSIKKVEGNIGDTSQMTTEAKDLASAINELDAKEVDLSPIKKDIEDLKLYDQGQDDKIIKNTNAINDKLSKDHDKKLHEVDQIHGMRLHEGNFEVWNGSKWEAIKGGQSIPIGPVTNLSAKADDQMVELTWTDPNDKVVDGIAVSTWKSTKILRKKGSYPNNENDGELVVENGVRNQYRTNPYIDRGLENEVTYYYMAFPKNTDGDYTIDIQSRAEATPVDQKIYGIKISKNNSNPKSAVTYADDAIGMQPVSITNGEVDWGSWRGFVDEIVKITAFKDKKVNYYIDKDDWAKKLGGGSSNLTGTDGDIMTEYEKIYWRWDQTSSEHYIRLSSKPFEGAVAKAHDAELGYNQLTYQAVEMLQILYLLLFKDLDSQTALGQGYTNSNSDYIANGTVKSLMYGEQTGNKAMSFLGHEHLWGNKYQWVEGCVSDSSYNILIGDKSFNDDGSGYKKITTNISSNEYGYIQEIQGGDAGFIIKSKGGSSSTYYCDYGSLYSGRVARFGGDRSDGSNAGVFDFRLSSSASSASATVGSRLICNLGDKLYIGCFLGSESGGKLRSVAGPMPQDNKTISAFRSLAKANN